jgi:hypothetical protein
VFVVVVENTHWSGEYGGSASEATSRQHGNVEIPPCCKLLVVVDSCYTKVKCLGVGVDEVAVSQQLPHACHCVHVHPTLHACCKIHFKLEALAKL